jgi:hypothetical protein
MAQLDPNGVLTGIRASVSATTTFVGQVKATALLASGALQGTDASTEGTERQFDPMWTLPVALLNRLDELSFVYRGVSNAAIGSLVLSRGWCRLISVTMVRDMWPAIGKVLEVQANAARQAELASSNRHQRRGFAKTSSQQQVAGPRINDIVEIAKHLPHANEFHMVTEEGDIWCTLLPECLLTKAEDLALMHGTVIPGEWFLLSVLNARPSEEPSPAWQSLPSSNIAGAMNDLLASIRELMGRPSTFYGVTPLVLFRKVTRVPPAPAVAATHREATASCSK